MALRDQPYLPLYVQDFLTDEKLILCSPEATGVYIRLMCIMHKSKEYGTFLLLQKSWQNSGKTSGTCQDFAKLLVKFLPWTEEEIFIGLQELIENDVLQIEANKLIQKRMVRDNRISEVRSEAGSKGGFAKAKSVAKGVAKHIANSENENEYEDESEIYSSDKKEVQEKEKNLKAQFEVFRTQYPGTKRGFDPEFENFKKKHKDWKDIVPILSDRLTYQINARKTKAEEGGFVPEWKNLQTWINQKCWEEEIAVNNVGHEQSKINSRNSKGATNEQLIGLLARKVGITETVPQ